MNCPSCNEENSVQNTYIEEYFIMFGWLDNIEISECASCGIQFYTAEQSKELDKRVANV